MTFAERLDRSQRLYQLGKEDRNAPAGVKVNGFRDYGIPLAELTRADLASYWLGATERDRVRAEP